MSVGLVALLLCWGLLRPGQQTTESDRTDETGSVVNPGNANTTLPGTRTQPPPTSPRDGNRESDLSSVYEDRAKLKREAPTPPTPTTPEQIQQAIENALPPGFSSDNIQELLQQQADGSEIRPLSEDDIANIQEQIQQAIAEAIESQESSDSTSENSQTIPVVP